MEFVVLVDDEPPFTASEPIVIGGGKLLIQHPEVKLFPLQKVIGVISPRLSRRLDEQEAEIAALKTEIRKLKEGDPECD